MARLARPIDAPAMGTKCGDPATRRSCLLVDDHETMLSSLSSLLRHEGFVVVGEAATGAEAIRLLGLSRPDLTVVDFRLPDMTGLDVAREAARIAPATVLVLHTGETGPAIAREALAAGVRGVVLKAVPPTHLLAAISAALAGDVYVDPNLTGAAPPG